MPNLEQVTCSEPTVTPINSAISSRLVPRSTRFLICWICSGVTLICLPRLRGWGAKLGDLNHLCTLCAVFAPTSALHRSCSPITKFRFGPEIRVISIFPANVPADATHWPKLPTVHHLVPPLFIEWRVENDYKKSRESGILFCVEGHSNLVIPALLVDTSRTPSGPAVEVCVSLLSSRHGSRSPLAAVRRRLRRRRRRTVPDEDRGGGDWSLPLQSDRSIESDQRNGLAGRRRQTTNSWQRSRRTPATDVSTPSSSAKRWPLA